MRNRAGRAPRYEWCVMDEGKLKMPAPGPH